MLFARLGVYRRVWEQASIGEMELLLRAGCLAAGVGALLGLTIPGLPGPWIHRVPFSVLALDALFVAAAITIPRYLARLQARRPRVRDNGRRVLIAGAGNGGQAIVREIARSPKLALTPIGFVDDDPGKLGRLVEALPVLGRLSDIQQIVRDHDVAEVIIAMPSAGGKVIRRVVREALDAGVKTRTVPGIAEILSNRVHPGALREVQIQDLLRRAPIETDLNAVAPIARNRVVLVTGAGGSIGSELCRQIARLAPSELVLLGHGENSIFDIYQELRAQYPGLVLTPVIADIRNRRRMNQVIGHHRPHTIFHAAAHKHVPLMETNVVEALANNVMGTRNVVAAAERADVPYFVLISSDKAVRPTSVMGATKRAAEQLVQIAAARTGRSYVAVRFGNVLGSRGSVIPTFLKQIRAGGPVTVTHPEMCRYFITTHEAVQLVLQACALGRRGEVFVLDMGEPIRIVDLATDLIRLSGLQVGNEVDIQFTGTRPGEKLFEEMFCNGEEVLPTSHPKVLRARQTDLPIAIAERLEALFSAIEANLPDVQLRRHLRALVPDFAGADTTPPLTVTKPIPVEIDRTDRELPRRVARELTLDSAIMRTNGDRAAQQRVVGEG
jgi:FlaA1/EpsC-like NDP-sugar epimerase